MSHMDRHRVRVGLRVAAARKEAGYGQEAFAVKVDVTRRHLSRIETGRNLPRPELLARIAEATGKTETFFESDDDEEAAPSMSLDAILKQRVDEQVAAAMRRLRAEPQT